MAIYASCDVLECDEMEKVNQSRDVPLGWSCIHRTDDLSDIELAKEVERVAQTPPPLFGSINFSEPMLRDMNITQEPVTTKTTHYIVCSKHLPEMKPAEETDEPGVYIA